MIDYLVKLDDSIVGRYRTLIRNIKSMSNSYYDSYLDMIEATIKRILDINDISYDVSKTCGYILREDNVKDFLLKDIKLDDFTFTKLIDYTKKVNDHKHKKEKSVRVETVINQMLTYHQLISQYLLFSEGQCLPEYEAEYYVSIFGITEKENKELKLESDRLKNEIESLSKDNKLSKDDIKAYQSIISFKNFELLSLEEQNHELQNQISKLKDIKLNSMEEKLSKAIDLLNNLTESVIENRAVSIAIGETIIGSDITESNYMKKAKESIDKKNKTVLGTLENQQAIIGLLGNKFRNVSIDDLMCLADRTFDVKDYTTAQEYYKGVLYLEPLNWKAFFLSSALLAYVPNFEADLSFNILNRRRLYLATMELFEKNNNNNYIDYFKLLEMDVNMLRRIITLNKDRYIKFNSRLIYDLQFVIYQAIMFALEKDIKSTAELCSTELIKYLNCMKIKINDSIDKDSFEKICSLSKEKFVGKYKTYTVKN